MGGKFRRWRRKGRHLRRNRLRNAKKPGQFDRRNRYLVDFVGQRGVPLKLRRHTYQWKTRNLYWRMPNWGRGELVTGPTFPEKKKLRRQRYKRMIFHKDRRVEYMQDPTITLPQFGDDTRKGDEKDYWRNRSKPLGRQTNVLLERLLLKLEMFHPNSVHHWSPGRLVLKHGKVDIEPLLPENWELPPAKKWLPGIAKSFHYLFFDRKPLQEKIEFLEKQHIGEDLQEAIRGGQKNYLLRMYGVCIAAAFAWYIVHPQWRKYPTTVVNPEVNKWPFWTAWIPPWIKDRWAIFTGSAPVADPYQENLKEELHKARREQWRIEREFLKEEAEDFDVWMKPITPDIFYRTLNRFFLWEKPSETVRYTTPFDDIGEENPFDMDDY